MNVRSVLVASLLLLSPAAFAAPVPDDPSVATSVEPFQVTGTTEIPNTTLQPGSYSIRVLDHLRDRMIIQVAGKGDHVKSTFLAIPAPSMAGEPAGPILYSTGAKRKAAALKGFAFRSGFAVEFVYPKDDAVSIAQANHARVMAIDPASENRPAVPNLSQTDMQMITLWMLEPAAVGPNDTKPSGIAASKYQPPAGTEPSAAVQTAQTEPAPASESTSSVSAARGTASSSPSTPARSSRSSRPVQVAQNDVPPAPRRGVRPAGVTSLPHTASAMPLVWLGALVSMLLGAGLSLRRMAWRG